MRTISDLPIKVNVDNQDLTVIQGIDDVTYKTPIYNLRNQTVNGNWVILLPLNSPYQSSNQEKLICDLETDDIEVLLPSNPSYGYEILLIINNPNSNTLVINRNNSTIQNTEDNLNINSNNLRISLIYSIDTWLLNFFDTGISGVHFASQDNGNNDNTNPNINLSDLYQVNTTLISDIYNHSLLQIQGTIV